MCKLAPSILAADFNRLGEQIQHVEEAGIRILHLDVMDGQFVPAISFGMPLITSIRRESRLFFDVHLMIEEPVRYFEDMVKAGADGITFHAEACEDFERTLACLKELPVKAAVSICPNTSVEVIESWLGQLDMVLIMSVEPGFGGQELIPSTLHKVEQLCRIREERGLSFQIEIDGGVNRENLAQVIECGTDIAVVGTAVFHGDIKKNIQELREVVAGAS